MLADDSRAACSRLTDHTHAIHLWHEKWRRAGVDQAPAFSPASLFGQLLRDFGV